MNKDQETRLKLLKAVNNMQQEALDKGLTPPDILISEAPKDPKEKKKWVYQMLRVQVALFVDEGAQCTYCGHQYVSVDDFLFHNPKKGYGNDRYICGSCWDSYIKGRKHD